MGIWTETEIMGTRVRKQTLRELNSDYSQVHFRSLNSFPIHDLRGSVQQYFALETSKGCEKVQTGLSCCPNKTVAQMNWNQEQFPGAKQQTDPAEAELHHEFLQTVTEIREGLLGGANSANKLVHNN